MTSLIDRQSIDGLSTAPSFYTLNYFCSSSRTLSLNQTMDQQYGPAIHLRPVGVPPLFHTQNLKKSVLEPSLNHLTIHQYVLSINRWSIVYARSSTLSLISLIFSFSLNFTSMVTTYDLSIIWQTVDVLHRSYSALFSSALCVLNQNIFP